jgi:hypothetical protein
MSVLLATVAARWRVIALVLAATAVLAAVGAQRLQIDGLKASLAAALAAHAADRAAWSKASAEASEAQREIEIARRRAQGVVIDAVRSDNAALARRAADLDAVAGRLRDEVDALAARAGEARCDSPTTRGGQATAAAAVVLADLYRSTDEEAVSLARAYDAARIAGLACERSYDALMP